MPRPSFAAAYTTLRGSKSFLVGLVTFISIWVAFHMIYGFDKDFGELNTILSSEASITLAFFTMVAAQQDKAMKEAIREIQRVGQASLDTAMAVRAVLEDHSEILHETQSDHKLMLEMLIEDGTKQ